jgi:hypothetical protein
MEVLVQRAAVLRRRLRTLFQTKVAGTETMARTTIAA